MVSLTERIHELGKSLLTHCQDGDDIGERLRSAFAPLLAPSFEIRFVGVKTSTGDVMIERALIIFSRPPQVADYPEPYVPAERVAGVLYVTKMLNEASLADGYALIGQVKALPGLGRASDEGWHHVPIGMIIACDCDRPLEELVEAIGRINSSVPSTRWADAISVLSRGVVNYAVQFEGHEIGGDFILPNTTGAMQFAIYVHIMVCSLGTYTFNRTCALLFMHLGCFSGKTALPTGQMVMEGVRRVAVNPRAYMFDPTDLLIPVPDEMRQDRGYGLQLMPYRIETQEGKLLSRLQFVPWLEGGGAIRVYGDLPLMPFILLLGKLNVRVQQMKTPDGSISSVLPVRKLQFEMMLSRMRQQSNIVVKLEQPSWTVTKMADEGTSSPVMARLFLNVLDLKKSALQTKKEVDAFEKPYELVLMSSSTVRDLAVEIEQLITDHRSKAARGAGVRIGGRTIHVDEPIDKELRRLVEAFLNSSNRLMLTGMKEVAKAFQLDIAFFFRKESTFLNGVAALDVTDPDLAKYCREARIWADKLNTLRNEMEHNFWSVPKAQYRIEHGSVEVLEPEVLGRSVSDFVKFITDRMLCFIEDICIHGIQKRMPESISVTEVPLIQRPTERPERFMICTAGGGMPLWKIAYHESKFDET
jgi:hypothetical protein